MSDARIARMSRRVGALILSTAVLACGCGLSKSRFRVVHRTQPTYISMVRLGSDVWLGSTAGGLILLPGGNMSATSFGKEAGLAGGFGQVRDLAAYRGDLILATGGGVARFSPVRAKVVQTWTPAQGLGSESVRCVEVVQGRIWAATINGVSRLLPGEKRWKNYRIEQGLSQNHVYRLIYDGKTLWASCINGGLVRFNPRTDRWESIPQFRGIGNKYIYAMDAAGDGLWLGTAGGVNYYSFARGWDEEVCKNAFTDYCVYTVRLAGDDLWFGTAFGLFKRDMKSGRQTAFTRSNGLPHDEITALMLDGNVLWIATKTGVVTTRIN